MNQGLNTAAGTNQHLNVVCLFQFSGEEEEKIKRAVGTYCSNQPSALELIKSKKKKDQRFYLFMQVRTPQCSKHTVCRQEVTSCSVKEWEEEAELKNEVT